jgi:hypothetical protein
MVRLHGAALVGFLLYAGQRGLGLVGLLHLCVICFHQIGMIASKKLRHPYHLPRELRQNRVYLYVFVLFLCKNENIYGFGTIGLNFLFLTKSVWRICALLLYFALFFLVVLV